MNTRSLKLFSYFAIITYAAVVSITKEWINSISIAVTIAAFLQGLYITVLWRYNPLEKTPKLHKKYTTTQITSHNCGDEFNTIITFRQTLFDIYVIEEWGDNLCHSITSALKQDESGEWSLYYTYRAHPAVRLPSESADEIHYGTVILHIKSSDEIFGQYFTNRHEMTRGSIHLTPFN